MSKSLGNIKSVKHVLENCGPNIIRLFCLSGHYSKAIDYSEELLKENITKWRQAELAYYEMIHAKGNSDTGDAQRLVSECKSDFNLALEDDFNTHLASNAFFRLVKETNQLASLEKITKSSAGVILEEFERMLGILGLCLPKISNQEIEYINQLIQNREDLRKQKKYSEADVIRDKISELNVELVDHKTGSIWVKKEKIKADS